MTIPIIRPRNVPIMHIKDLDGLDFFSGAIGDTIDLKM